VLCIAYKNIKERKKMRREFINESILPGGLFMLNCGHEKCDGPFFCSPEEDSFFRIFNVTDGEGAFECGGERYRAEKGDFFIFRPGVKIKYSSDGSRKLWSFCWVSFGGTDAEFYLSETGITGLFARKRSDTRAFLGAVIKCLDLCSGEKGAASQAEVNSLLLEAISALKPRRTQKVRLRASEQAERALHFIEFNYMRGITARDVTAELNIDRTHFFRIFKAKTGLSPEQYIMKFRIKKAKELLENSAYTVTEIASLVGVNDVYYFSKLFKKAEGISPTEYRKKAQGGV